MDLKRCRELSKQKNLIHSDASYIKLLDYAERLEAEIAELKEQREDDILQAQADAAFNDWNNDQ